MEITCQILTQINNYVFFSFSKLTIFFLIVLPLKSFCEIGVFYNLI